MFMSLQSDTNVYEFKVTTSLKELYDKADRSGRDVELLDIPLKWTAELDLKKKDTELIEILLKCATEFHVMNLYMKDGEITKRVWYPETKHEMKYHVNSVLSCDHVFDFHLLARWYCILSLLSKSDPYIQLCIEQSLPSCLNSGYTYKEAINVYKHMCYGPGCCNGYCTDIACDSKCYKPFDWLI